MTSSTADHRATGRGRTHIRCIESSHNDIIIVTGMVEVVQMVEVVRKEILIDCYRDGGGGRTHKEVLISVTDHRWCVKRHIIVTGMVEVVRKETSSLLQVWLRWCVKSYRKMVRCVKTS